mgnify:CR=1 FL=1
MGNSYIYYGDSLHNHFKRMVEEYLTDYDGGASVKSATIGGSRLKHHDVERLIKPKAISSVKHFDFVSQNLDCFSHNLDVFSQHLNFFSQYLVITL